MGYKWTESQFIVAVKVSTSIAGVLRMLGLVPCGGNYATFKQTVRRLGADTSHFLGQGHAKGGSYPGRGHKAFPLSVVLVKDRPACSNQLRSRLIREGLLEARCSMCGRVEWEGVAIPLELDHINGDRLDNRIENLRVCCPNCHTLTPTYRGRNIKIRRRSEKACTVCGKAISKGATNCMLCARRIPRVCRRKVQNRPTVEELQTTVAETSYCAAGRKYGVSATTVRNWMR